MTESSRLALVGLRSGYRFEARGAYGFKTTGSSSSAIGGYALSTETGKDGVPYTAIKLTASSDAADPPGFELAAFYEQLVSYAEVDLDLRYTDIPDGTEVEVEATNAVFAIPRQPIQGSSLIGAIGEDAGTFDTDLVLRLWIETPEKLRSSSSLALSFSRIEKDGGSDRKILMQKFAVTLSN